MLVAGGFRAAGTPEDLATENTESARKAPFGEARVSGAAQFFNHEPRERHEQSRFWPAAGGPRRFASFVSFVDKSLLRDVTAILACATSQNVTVISGPSSAR